MNNKLDELKEILTKARIYNHAINILYFDVETIAPKDALEDENNTMNYFSNELFKILNNDHVNNLVIDLYKEKDNLDYYDKLLIEKLYEAYLKNKNITPEFDLKRNKIYSKSYVNWLKAKEAKDYNLFKEELIKALGKDVDIVTIGSQMDDFFKEQLDLDKIKLW